MLRSIVSIEANRSPHKLYYAVQLRAHSHKCTSGVPQTIMLAPNARKQAPQHLMQGADVQPETCHVACTSV